MMPEKLKNQMERRTFNVTTLSLRKDEDEKKRIVGHAAVFDTVGDGGWFREKIAPGAFKKSIEADDVRALFNHDPNFVLGRNKAGTLKMREDEKGLWIEIDPPDTQFARDLSTSIERGDISQMSFGFEIISEERQKGDGTEPDLFTLREVKLWDVSPVTFPFYTQTDVSVHSREQWSQRQAAPAAGMRLSLLRREFNLRRL
jgi:HK97 family phage prohead protease